MSMPTPLIWPARTSCDPIRPLSASEMLPSPLRSIRPLIIWKLRIPSSLESITPTAVIETIELHFGGSGKLHGGEEHMFIDGSKIDRHAGDGGFGRRGGAPDVGRMHAGAAGGMNDAVDEQRFSTVERSGAIAEIDGAAIGDSIEATDCAACT